jgi:CubicO group peptidase (beta-lactamase class C family)
VAQTGCGVGWRSIDRKGYHYGASDLRLPARDRTKFGYSYFNGGHWDGNQLIPADYVAAATSPKGWCRVLGIRD